MVSTRDLHASVNTSEQPSPLVVVRRRDLPSYNHGGWSESHNSSTDRDASLPSQPLRSLSINDDIFDRRGKAIRRSRSIDTAQLQRFAEGSDTSFDITESKAQCILMEAGEEEQEKKQPRKLIKKSKSLRAMNAAVSQFG